MVQETREATAATVVYREPNNLLREITVSGRAAFKKIMRGLCEWGEASISVRTARLHVYDSIIIESTALEAIFMITATEIAFVTTGSKPGTVYYDCKTLEAATDAFLAIRTSFEAFAPRTWRASRIISLVTCRVSRARIA